MAYRVTAGYVTVETKINERGSRAQVDIPRGADLPGDVPREQVETLLRLGRIEEVSDEATADKWDPEKPLDKYTVPQLKEWASDHKVDLGGATKKPEILAAIAATFGADGDGDGGGGHLEGEKSS